MHELVSLQNGNSLLTDLDQDISTQCTVMDKSCFYKFVSNFTNKLVKQLLPMTVYCKLKSIK